MNEFHASDTVGGYRLEARLGGGGFGTVWRARRLTDSQVVALKLLPPDTAGRDDTRLRADVELLAAAAAANSPHVVRVLDGGVEPVPYVAMEFIYGTSLAEELRQRQRLPQTEVIEIGLAIADALKALNAAGIVHRDVKPSNVMLDRNGTVKLTDFGIAKIAGFDAVTLTGQLPLSIAFAAPEVWEGRAEHRSDLYALAILLYQCLTGTLPFRGAYAELFYLHRTKEPDLTPLPPDTVPSLIELIRTCLEKAPADRPENADVCIELLRKAAEEATSADDTVVVPEIHEPERFGPWVRGAAIEGQPWAWRVRHETSGQEGVLEVHFSDSVQYGEALRRAVGANDRLVPLGAERLLQTNRLILRPNEAWSEQMPGTFQFWVVREAVELPPAPSQITPRLALRLVESLIALIDAADEEGVPLKLDRQELSVLEDGSIHLKHPGFPSSGHGEPEAQAMAYLRSLPLTRDIRANVMQMPRLADARRTLATVNALRDFEPQRTDTAFEPEPLADDGEDVPAEPEAVSSRRHFIFALMAGAAVLGVLAAVAAVLFLGNGGNDEPPVQAVATVTPSPVVDSAVAACMGLALPAPLSSAEDVCGNGIAAFNFDSSCPRGQACTRRSTGSGISLGINDRSVAFIDANGNLAIAREDGSDPLPLTSHGRASQPAWSPDGRYIAYVMVLPVEPAPTPTPPPPGTPVPPSTPAPPGPLFVTQLHVIEADRSANDGVLLATGTAPNAPAHLQRYSIWPQWSPDGTTLYFLSVPVSQPGGVIFGVDVPRSGNDIDFRSLRSGLPANETLLPSKLNSYGLIGGDFGQTQAYIGRFTVRNNGEFLVQLCEGDRAQQSCGLGLWDGQASRLVPTERNVVMEPPVDGPDGSFAYVREANGSGALLHIGQDGQSARLPHDLEPASAPRDGAWFNFKPQVAVTRRGDAVLAPIGNGQLGGIRLEDGASSPWLSGSSPVWYVSRPVPQQIVPAPAASLFQTPTPEPTATAVPTQTPRPSLRPMSITLSVRRGVAALSGAIVIATVNGQNCASGTTDAGGRTVISFPRDGAPAGCSQPDANVRFLVNNTPVEQNVNYIPQSSPVLDLVLP